MIKFLGIVAVVTMLSFFLSQHVAFGQTVTPTKSPTPTTSVPSGAPATGFGPN